MNNFGKKIICLTQQFWQVYLFEKTKTYLDTL